MVAIQHDHNYAKLLKVRIQLPRQNNIKCSVEYAIEYGMNTSPNKKFPGEMCSIVLGNYQLMLLKSLKTVTIF